MAVKSWWSNTSPTVRRGLRGIVIALISSFAVIAIAYALLLWILPVGDLKVTPGRAVAFVDAVLSGIVAFAMVGAFAFVESLRKPEDDTIGDRIAYLYSARLDENHATKRYLTDRIMLLGSAIKEAEYVYSFLELDAINQAVRMSVRVSMTIVNMMKRDMYEQDMPVRVGLDTVPGHENGMGVMLLVETTPCSVDGAFGEKVSHLPQPVPLANNGGKYGYESKVLLKIPPHGELRYEYVYEGWVRTKDNFWTAVNRFAESVSIRVGNLTGAQFKILPNPIPTRPKYLNIERACD